MHNNFCDKAHTNLVITHSTDVEAEVDDADWKRVGPFYFYLIKQSANLLRVQKSRGRELSILLFVRREGPPKETILIIITTFFTYFVISAHHL